MTLRSRMIGATVAGLLAAGVLTATPGLTTSASATVHRATFAPTLKVGRPNVVAGSPVTISGKVHPAHKGLRVVLQKLNPDSKKWVVEARLKTGPRGGFSYRDRPHAPGVRHYRVVVPAAGKVRAGRSKTVTMTVYRWLGLGTKVATRNDDGTYRQNKSTINGRSYGSSFVGARYSSAGSADWNLYRSCLRVRATFGVGDDSDEGTTSTLSVTADQKSRYAGTFSLGQPAVTKMVDVTGAFRVAFAWDTAGDATGVNAVMAEPEALCSF